VFDYDAVATYIVRYLAVAGIGGLVFSISRDSAKADSSHIVWSWCKAFFAGGVVTMLLCVFSGWLFPTLIYDAAASESSQMVALLISALSVQRMVLIVGDDSLMRRQRPNQAMQLTASKTAIYVLSVCHRAFSLRRSHIGLAAADLVSR
jgi:hypothetical protein